MKPRRRRHLRLVDDGADDGAADPDPDSHAVEILLTDNSGFDWSGSGDLDGGEDGAALLQRLKQLAAEVVLDEGVSTGMLHLHLVDPGFMSYLNKAFMGYDGATDVLAFPIDGPELAGGSGVDLSLVPDTGDDSEAFDAADEPPTTDAVGGIEAEAPSDHTLDDEYAEWYDDDEGPVPVHLGDVMVCPQVAAGQADDHAGSLRAELCLLVIHGVLHVLGHDHAEPAEAARMRGRERRHLERLGYRHPVDR